MVWWHFESSHQLLLLLMKFCCVSLIPITTFTAMCDILADINDCQRTLKSKHAKRDKLRVQQQRKFEVRVVIFLNLWACWLDYSKVRATLNWQERPLHQRFGHHNIQILGYNQSQSTRKYIWENVLGTLSSSHLKTQKLAGAWTPDSKNKWHIRHSTKMAVT